MTISGRQAAYLAMLGSICLLIYTMRKGEIGMGAGRRASRKDEPLMFWFIWLFFFVLVLFAVSALLLEDIGII
jgi:lipid-A-disaccharide synthase-like uncharacterized protein